MKGKYGGPIPVDNLYQAFWQDRPFFQDNGILYVKGVFLYFTPCDRAGQPVAIRDKWGRPIDGYASAGCYDSAADALERAADRLLPMALVRHVDS